MRIAFGVMIFALGTAATVAGLITTIEAAVTTLDAVHTVCAHQLLLVGMAAAFAGAGIVWVTER